MTGILEGIKVVDMGHFAAIPCAGATLADWGAEVIKVEPLTGELVRGVMKTSGESRRIKFAGGEVDFIVEAYNRNKKSLALDLKNESGKNILYQLIKGSDIFMSNYEVSALKKLKMDYATLSQLNPRLIYAVLTGYGTAGPDKDERGFDATAAWARSGMQYLIAQEGCPPPMQRLAMMDRVASTHVVSGILAAVIHRDRSGEGQELECSLYHTGVWTLLADIQAVLMGQSIPRFDRTRAASPLSNTYCARDDRWFLLAMPQADLHWPYLCKAIERPELENDPRFSDMEVRQQNGEELIRILDEVFASRNLKEWEKVFRENNIIYGRIQTPQEVISDPQALANNFFAEINHPVAGPMRYVTTPVTFHQNPTSVRTPAPQIGQHTEEVLLDLGYTWEDIIKFKDENVIL